MRFTAIDLLAFGHFSRRTLVFPAEGPNLHLVYGANEAGKSTLLRAITGFLYGFDARPVDAHRFEASELRVGARIRHSTGRERYFIRRKSPSGTLLDADGHPVEDSQLADWLSVRERKLFEGIYGLNHEQLRAAGEALASSKQAVAEALFSAALEGSALRNTLSKLQEESETLLTTAGRAGEIFKAAKEWNEWRDAERNAEGSVGKWKRLQEDLSHARAAALGLDDDIRKTRMEVGRLQRVARTLPWLRIRADAIAQRAAMEPVHLLDPGMSQRRRDVLRERDDAELALKSLRQRLDKARVEREQIVIPEALTTMVPSLQAFNQRLGIYAKAAVDKPALVHEILPLKRDAEEILRDLGRPELPLDEVETLRVLLAERERIQSLQTEHAKLVGAWDQSRARLSDLEADRDEARARADESSVPRDVAVLREVWRRGEPDHDIDRLLRDADDRRADHARAVEARTVALGLPATDVDSLPSRRVPTEESILAADRQAEGERRDVEALAARRRAATASVEAVQRDLAALVGDGPLPSVEALLAVRQERDHLWTEAREVGIVAGQSDGGMPDRPARLLRLLDSLGGAIHRADAVADALREQAARVARQVDLLRRSRDAEDAARAIEREAGALTAADAQRRAEWAALWREVGINPGTPQQMLAWRTQWLSLVGEVERMRAIESERAGLLAREAELRRGVAAALGLAGIPIGSEVPWSTLRAIAEKTITDETEASRGQAAARDRLADLERGVARARAQHAEIEEAQASWRLRWEAAVTPLGGRELVSPEAATAVLDHLVRLFKATETRGRLEKRIAAMKRDMDDFEETLVDSLRRAGLSLAGSTVERAEGLAAAVARAQQDADRRCDLDQEIARWELEGIGHEDRRERAMAGLRRLFEEAACDSVETLEEAEARSDAARALDARRVEAESRLAELGEGWSLEELDAAVAGQDSDRIRDTLETLQAELDMKEHQRQAAVLSLGELQGREAAFGAGDEAARCLQEKQTRAEKARALAGRYARLQVATSLLRLAMARYQEESQGAVLKRAEALFAKLTRGRYEKLRVEFESEGATIRCVRDGEAVQVRGRVMSDGTLDQLYLALRLASIEEQLTLQEPMPLVLDDIFINFDDGRARAGIEVLAEFAKKTQVLFFTHHGRNLDLAREALAAGSWNEVHLDQVT